MDIVKAAELTLRLVCGDMHPDNITYRPERRPGKEDSQPHLHWMLNGIVEGYIQHEKAHRWLGFVQGALVARNIATVDQMKSINQQA